LNVGIPMPHMNPSVTGTVTSYSVSPDLPPGLSIDTVTGRISGTPTEVSPRSPYVITARNAVGSTSFTLDITVLAAPPSALSYPSPVVLQEGKPMIAISPTVSGETTNFSISPELPDGLLIYFDTGQIVGMPVVSAPQTVYHVTAANSGGHVTFPLTLTVNPRDPPNYSHVMTFNSVNDAVWSAREQLLYLAIGSTARRHPNSVIAFDPTTGNIPKSVFAGSEPWSLGLADDESFLYVGLRGADEIKRYTLPALTHDLTILPDPTDRSIVPQFANRIAVAPGSPRTIAIELLDMQHRGLIGIRLFDDDVARDGPPNSDHLALSWGDDASTLLAKRTVGLLDDFLDTFSTNGTEVNLVNSQPLQIGRLRDGLPYYDGLVFTNFETVIDVASSQLVARLPAAVGHVIVDRPNGKAFYARIGEPTRLSIKSFDLTSYEGIEAVTNIGIPSGSPVRHMVRWGTDGLALTMKSGILLTLSGDFVTEGSAGTPMSEIPGGAHGTHLVVPAFEVLSTPANDIAWDAPRGVMYASVPSSAAANPGTIAVIDPATGMVMRHVPTTTNPGPLAISDDGQYLYVGEVNSFERFRLPDLELDLTVPLADGTPSAVEVAPGAPGTVAVACPGIIHVFDNATVRPNAALGHRVIWGEDASQIFILHSESSAFTLQTYLVSASGLTRTDNVDNKLTTMNPLAFRLDFEYSEGLIFGGTGVIYNPATRRLVGTLPIPLSAELPLSIFERQTTLGAMVIEADRDRAYYATFTDNPISTSGTGQILLLGFDTTTFTPVFRAAPVGISGAVTRLLRINPTTFAMRNGAGQISVVSSPDLAL
jgi:hypothetical protein